MKYFNSLIIIKISIHIPKAASIYKNIINKYFVWVTLVLLILSISILVNPWEHLFFVLLNINLLRLKTNQNGFVKIRFPPEPVEPQRNSSFQPLALSGVISKWIFDNMHYINVEVGLHCSSFSSLCCHPD